MGFYMSLAKDSIKKNRKLYYPYILSSSLMVAIFYIVTYLATCKAVKNMRGGSILSTTLILGIIVIGLFSFIFLNYTNSFLRKRREKEYGLYYVLGMNKRNISKLIYREGFLTGTVSILIGLFFGISTSKVFEILLLKIVQSEITFTFEAPVIAIGATVVFFAVVFFLVNMLSALHIRRKNAVDIIKSDNVGEKPPKSKWLLGFLGVMVLAAGYIIALIFRDPISAIMMFFVAVLIVIAGTYLVFIAFSVTLVSILQKRDSYYKTQNFISLSSLRFRMKRNGAGLASICILSTMMLVTISTTACLYLGQKASLDDRFRMDYIYSAVFRDYSSMENGGDTDRIVDAIRERLDITEDYSFSESTTYAYILKDTAEADSNRVDGSDLDVSKHLRGITVMTPEEFRKYSGETVTVEDGYCYIFSDRKYKYDTFGFTTGERLNVKKYEGKWKYTDDFYDVVEHYLVVTDNPQYLLQGVTQGVRHTFTYGFNANDSFEKVKSELSREIEGLEHTKKYYEAKETDNEDFVQSFGSLFFIGIILSVVFLIVTVMIIYYKQITEGYEDQVRFNIMEKVGLSKKDIRKSIDRQMLIVFFSPMLLAVSHLLFAFPMIRGILKLFMVSNMRVLIMSTALVILVFTLGYTLVYRLTAGAYYDIVSSDNR